VKLRLEGGTQANHFPNIRHVSLDHPIDTLILLALSYETSKIVTSKSFVCFDQGQLKRPQIVAAFCVVGGGREANRCSERVGLR
jgi:hypothetical protein